MVPITQQQINGGTQIQANTVGSGQVASSIIVAGGGNAFTGDQSLGSHKITNLATPVSSTDAATKGYVDAAAQGLTVKAACQAATTSALSFTIASGSVTTITGTTVDGYSPAINDFILVKDAPASTGAGSANSSQPGNGIYIVTGNTTNLSVSRATFMSSTGDAAQGAFTFIESGTANASSGWVVSAPAADATCTYGTTAIAWTQFSGAGEVTTGNVLTKVGNQLSVSSMSTNQIILGNAGTPTITTLSGDVTVGATGTMTIGSGVVSLSKIASAAFNTVATASTLAEWDANVNLSANSFISNFRTTATAAGTTTLTITDAQIQAFTGSSTQTVKLPTTGVVAGAKYTVINESSGNVSVQSSGANAILTLAGAASAPFAVAEFTAVVATPTTAANWVYAQFTTGTASGTVTSVSVASANGFAGTVATATSTPAITISTSITGVVKGNGTAISAATAGTDYLAPATLFSGATTINAYVVRELVSGTKNGSNTTFTIAHTPVSGSEMLFQNGVLLEGGGGSFDYGISSGTITMTNAPAGTDSLYCTYWY